GGGRVQPEDLRRIAGWQRGNRYDDGHDLAGHLGQNELINLVRGERRRERPVAPRVCDGERRLADIEVVRVGVEDERSPVLERQLDCAVYILLPPELQRWEAGRRIRDLDGGLSRRL